MFDNSIGQRRKVKTMTISVRVKQNGISTQWGMFLSIGAAQVYMRERGYSHYEVLRGSRVVHVQ